ncbi:head GIN domain-containing protein, partial [Sphingomonas sp.]|uniref:head GIN domain-containing protein n=1 Tax=Sphingomonas sp. TaxID=28214 RepID=UPI002B9E0C01
SYPVADFTRVTNAAPADVRVTTGPTFAVRARGDKDIIDSLDIARRGNALHIGVENNAWRWGNRGSATVDVTMPRIDGAAIAGAGDMTIDRGAADFQGEVSGAGNMTIGRIEGGAVRLSISGAGDIGAAGVADRLRASIAGTGSIRARDLTARGAEIDMAGAGDITANVDGDARVSMAGVGSVDLGPRARCRVSKAGVGSVKCGN